MTSGHPDFIVMAGGLGPSASTVDGLDPSVCTVVAADSGLDRAVDLGWTDHVDVVVGDFDSVSHEALDAAAIGGADIRPFPPDKDWTDLELALATVVELADGQARSVVVLGVAGGRPDHALANLLVLAIDAFGSLAIEWRDDASRGWVVRGELMLPVADKATVSVMPVGGPATVSLDGFQWPLDGRVIQPGSTLGLSNITIGATSTVIVHDGVALVIAPSPPASATNGASP